MQTESCGLEERKNFVRMTSGKRSVPVERQPFPHVDRELQASFDKACAPAAFMNENA